MVPLYAVFLAAVGGLKWALVRRAARTEKKYTAAALAAQQAARPVKPGNAASGDALATAKRQYELGRLVQVRDALEARYLYWQAKADQVGAYLRRQRAARGRLVPYLLGIVDVNLVFAAMHRFGLPAEFDPNQLRVWVETLVK
jgi:hypothetical protein